MRVLVIDDDPSARLMVRLIVEEEGHEVVEAENGKAGLALCSANLPDAVITDIFMPERDGIEVIREILPRLGPERIIAITGGGTHFQPGYALRAAAAFCAGNVLSKPLKRDALVARIRAVAEVVAAKST